METAKIEPKLQGRKFLPFMLYFLGLVLLDIWRIGARILHRFNEGEYVNFENVFIIFRSSIPNLCPGNSMLLQNN